jgi:DNA-binding GntR family transcriptional regulator
MPTMFGGKGGDSSGSSESEEAAQDILDAMKDGDPKALDLALKRHYELCKGETDEVEPDADDEEF